MANAQELKSDLDRLIEQACRQPGVREAAEVYERSAVYQSIIELNEQYCQPATLTSSSSTTGPALQAA